MNVQFFYTRQSSPTGLGDAIRLAESFVNNEPFIVALGDSLIFSQNNPPLLERMINLYHAESRSNGDRYARSLLETMFPNTGLLSQQERLRVM